MEMIATISFAASRQTNRLTELQREKEKKPFRPEKRSSSRARFNRDTQSSRQNIVKFENGYRKQSTKSKLYHYFIMTIRSQLVRMRSSTHVVVDDDVLYIYNKFNDSRALWFKDVFKQTDRMYSFVVGLFVILLVISISLHVDKRV